MFSSLSEIQDQLYHISAHIASNGNEKYLKRIKYEEKLESDIDKMDNLLPPLKNFIHPGGCIESSHLHVARAISRRVERNYVAYSRNGNNDLHLKFFNRLSDYLFICARFMNYLCKTEDVIAK
jgi:cob(I)alamin adenosyltransferase